jgi:peptidoglycan/LPS O-acetylase OafA/YrhL
MEDQKLNYRHEIDGLRAIAVLSVVIFHAFPTYITGGFIGVDIFFVISGYLISTIILREMDKGYFNFLQFYIRRIKRIFPSLIIVMGACFIVGWFTLLPDEYKNLGKHILGGVSFTSNFILLNESGYFDVSSDTKPLLHLWSLGIEEQFYIIWPLLLWIFWKKNINIFTAIVFLSSVSFLLNLKGVKQDMVATFFLPQTRFWELLSGGLLAWVLLFKKNTFFILRMKVDNWLSIFIYNKKPINDGNTLSNFTSCIGLCLLTYGFFAINKESYYPGLFATIPVLGAILIIASRRDSWVNRVLLSNRVFVWFGQISYPLYLWHWSLLAFSKIIIGDLPSLKIRISCIFISIILAWITYNCVERPIRFSGLIRNNITLPIFMLMLAFVGGIVYLKDGLMFRLDEKANQIKLVTNWPQSKNYSAACKEKYGSQFNDYCLISHENQDPEIVIFGDSTANHLFDGVHVMFDKTPLLMIGQGACVPFMGLTTLIDQGDLKCQNTINPALDLIVNTPSVQSVIISMMGAGYVNGRRDFNGGYIELRRVGHANKEDASLLFEDGMRQTLSLLQSKGKKIFFILSIPRLKSDPLACMKIRPVLFPFELATVNCSITKAQFIADNDMYRKVVFNVLKDFPEVKVFDPSLYLCDEELCNFIIDNKLIYRDSLHLTVDGSVFIGKHIKNFLATSK